MAGRGEALPGPGTGDRDFADFSAHIPDPTAWTSRHLRRLAPVKPAEMTAGEPYQVAELLTGLRQAGTGTAAGISDAALREALDLAVARCGMTSASSSRTCTPQRRRTRTRCAACSP